jgi:hypothetical protein
LNPDPFAFADDVTFQDEVGAKRRRAISERGRVSLNWSVLVCNTTLNVCSRAISLVTPSRMAPPGVSRCRSTA